MLSSSRLSVIYEQEGSTALKFHKIQHQIKQTPIHNKIKFNITEEEEELGGLPESSVAIELNT